VFYGWTETQTRTCCIMGGISSIMDERGQQWAIQQSF
jgi:hypothetical protein